MDELFGHRRRRSNYHYQHNTSISMLAVESYSQSTELSARGRSQFTHQLDSSSSLQGDGGPNDSLNTTEISGAKSPSTASRFLSNMRRSLSYSGPSKKREATIAVSLFVCLPETLVLCAFVLRLT